MRPGPAPSATARSSSRPWRRRCGYGPESGAKARCRRMQFREIDPFTAPENARRNTGMPKAKDVIGYAKDKNVTMVDLKFMDFLGLWQHFTIPLAELTEGVFEEGLGFDGPSIPGWMPIH